MTKPIPLPEESKYIDTSKWQDSSDPIERMAYWINWLSPHNLWKSKSALQEMLSQARQEAVKLAEKRVAVAYQKALLEVGKISPGLLQQINALAYEAMQKGQNE